MKRLIKNKFVLLIISVIVVSLVYFGTQKVIDNYVFNTNSDIVSEEGIVEGDDGGDLLEQVNGENTDVISKDSSGEIPNEEIDLEVEEAIDESETEGENANREQFGVESDDSNNDDTKLEENKIYVYITGEVNNPGVVTLKEGSRIVDAINAAGGTTAKANVSKVNLVYVLEDGMKVNIPNDNDLKKNSEFEYITMNSGDGRRDDYSDKSSGGTSSSGGDSSSTSSDSYKNYSIVNINTATQTELETLPGIGPSLALNIINYRKENGKFSSIDEIKNVSGIGESKFETIKNLITV